MGKTENLSLAEALQIVATELERIAIPVSMMAQIGEPILRQVENIRVCIQALGEQNKPEADGIEDGGPAVTEDEV